MKDKLHVKPDFISFYRSEWKRESRFIYCEKTGQVFEQVHRNRYRLIYCILFIILLIISFLFVILLPVELPRIITYMPQLLLFLLISLYPVITYIISQYKLIEDEDIIKKIKETDDEDNDDEQG